MTIQEITKALGIDHYPELAEEIFVSEAFQSARGADGTDFIRPEYIRRIDAQYQVFGEDLEAVVEAAQQIGNDEALRAWGNLAVAYLDAADGDVAACKAFPMPRCVTGLEREADEKEWQTALDVFPMIVLLDQIPKTYERYRKRGFSHEEAMESLTAFGKNFRIISDRLGRPILNSMYYSWLCNYVGARIFHYCGFNFEVKKFEHKAVYIKNRESGELKALMLEENVHASGYLLGSKGCEDDTDAFVTALEETEDALVGFAANEQGILENRKETFSKANWEKVLVPGDTVISFHIPRSADLSPENLDRAFAAGAQFANKYYGDEEIKGIYCISWLLSPQLRGLLSDTSRILAFGDRFVRFPHRDEGQAVFSFVFPANIKCYEDLPENTTLERSLKMLYLAGECIYQFPGFFETTDQSSE